MTQLTLGSLFDGIGGFPLAGIYAGMNPIWASEIEPFCSNWFTASINGDVLSTSTLLKVNDAKLLPQN